MTATVPESRGSRRRTGRAGGVIRAALLVVTMALGLGLLPAPAAWAQDDEVAPSRAVEPESVADMFFISKRTLPGSDEKRVEILGSLIIWMLLLLSVLSLGLIGFMALTNQRKSILPPGVAEEAKRLLVAGNYREALDLTKREPSFFSHVLGAALRNANHGFGAMVRSLEQTSDELTTERLRRIEYLNVLGQVSPMIGLFGTVYGMILAFQSIVAAGGNADPVLLAGGIGTALTTTFWGLVVAIPALAGYAIVRNQIDALTAEATIEAEDLINHFRPRSAARVASGTGAARKVESPS